MPPSDVTLFKNYHYGIAHELDEKPDNFEFNLHNHNDLYEILVLLNGQCEFYVEGNIYELKKNDIVITRPFELHRINFKSDKPYERMIIYVTDDYFAEKNCHEFMGIFKDRNLGSGNIITPDDALINCAHRLDKYIKAGEYKVADAVMLELLYLLNQTKHISSDIFLKNNRIRDIIIYINNHLQDKITLDALAKRFFFDKFYMCKAFKKHTGYTITQYVNYKRILAVSELYKQGMSLTQASIEAGFNSYTHFYKMYVRQFGKPPKTIGE